MEHAHEGQPPAALPALQSLSDDELLERLAALLQQSRRIESDLVGHIAEVDARRLFLREACPSMFAYCTDVLHLSEAEAYLRIAAARAAREHPVLLEMLTDGRLHLSGIVLLAPHLTHENRERVLAQAIHRSKRQIEDLVAELAPRPDAPTVIRRLPPPPARPVSATELRLDGVGPQVAVRRDSDVLPPGAHPDRRAGLSAIAADAARVPATPPQIRASRVEPLSPGRYRVQFTASAALREKLERLQALMRDSVPDGDLSAVIDNAVTEKLQRLEARRFARTAKPRTRQLASGARDTVARAEQTATTRHIPAAVRRAVHERDGGRCRYVDAQGRRCTARERLEFHHRHPCGFGGVHSLENICLMCHAHNAHLAEVDYGRAVAERRRALPSLGTTAATKADGVRLVTSRSPGA